ncbi:histone-lysine N-methyltransferase, H3 lysine-79 specific-like [Gordionus sp. m RMFG-2023]|uniref:histone-lysine N-methyltransferase, H3 lysine-79 specific-like n=1 Tax=Gordionus sp. m RMFG-2023 TaxID=3053472 RepID=UPI0031FCEC77
MEIKNKEIEKFKIVERGIKEEIINELEKLKLEIVRNEKEKEEIKKKEIEGIRKILREDIVREKREEEEIENKKKEEMEKVEENERKVMSCSNCGRTGHTLDKCFKREQTGINAFKNGLPGTNIKNEYNNVIPKETKNEGNNAQEIKEIHNLKLNVVSKTDDNFKKLEIKNEIMKEEIKLECNERKSNLEQKKLPVSLKFPAKFVRKKMENEDLLKEKKSHENEKLYGDKFRD